VANRAVLTQELGSLFEAARIGHGEALELLAKGVPVSLVRPVDERSAVYQAAHGADDAGAAAS
jgi:hypothetical protein